MTGILRSRAALSNEELHVERIALFDDEVQTVEELTQVVGANTLRLHDDGEVGIDLCDATGGHDCLVDAQSSTLAGTRLRLDNSNVSKSARRISPARPSIAMTWAMV